MPRQMTADRMGPDPPVLVHDQIGPKRALTPEGFLLCEDVPIARAGWMLYGDGQTPVKVGPDGLARIYRSREELLHPDAIRSFVGKPVVDEHPAGGYVTPENYQRLAKGHILSARPGEGELSDCIVADLLITDADTIRLVDKEDKREVSCGYEAAYEDKGGGQGEQHEIRGNHLALVVRGRCGPRCAIGDQDDTTQLKGAPMPGNTQNARPRKKLSQKVLDQLSEVLSDPEAMSDEGEGEPEGGAGSSNGVHVHLHMGGSGSAAATPPAAGGETTDDPNAPPPAAGGGEGDLGARVASLESKMDQIIAALQGGGGGTGDNAPPEVPPKKDETDPPPAVTGDSAALQTGFQAVLADCEILVPGFRAPAFDSALPRAATIDSMCAMRRRALDLMSATNAGQSLLSAVADADADLQKMSCESIAIVFRAAAGAKRLQNNTAATGDSGRVPPQAPLAAAKKGPPVTPAEFNAAMRKLYAQA
jgi:hypothetical protein